jgi:ectoine hydroxylase-related dioxygenase (phytanoyl-CoA dioxygenase family)
MVKTFTPDELDSFAAFYEEHGVVKLPGLIEPEWVDKIRAAIEDAEARVDEVRPAGSGVSYGVAPGRMTIRHLWRENPVVREFLLRPEMAEPIARIVGSKRLRFWADLTFIHDAAADAGRGEGTPWHHDVAAFAFKGDLLPSLWMAMTPCNAERSRLKFIDRSHKTAPFYRPPTIGRERDSASNGWTEMPDFDALIASGEREVVTWDCEPGDAIILHPYTVHGADGNRGEQGAGRRIAITTRWFGDDVRFLPLNGNGHNGIPGVEESPIPVGGKPQGPYFPLVWSSDPAEPLEIA